MGLLLVAGAGGSAVAAMVLVGWDAVCEGPCHEAALARFVLAPVLGVVAGALAVLSGVGLLMIRAGVPAAAIWCAVVGGLVLAGGAMASGMVPMVGVPAVLVGTLVLVTALRAEVAPHVPVG